MKTSFAVKALGALLLVSTLGACALDDCGRGRYSYGRE